MLVTHLLNHQRLIRAASLASVACLAACGGGGSNSSSTTAALFDTNSDDTTIPNEENAETGRADFTIVDFTFSPTYERSDEFVFLVRIANIGEKGDRLPPGWLTISDSEDFSTGFEVYPIRLSDTEERGSGLLEPGAERDFRGYFRELLLTRNGIHYARFWLNPDLSANFSNPEPSVTASFQSDEKDTSNNQSGVVAFTASKYFGNCVPDYLEENDTLATAAPILFDTDYKINSCDDQLDVFTFEAQAGGVFELTFDKSDLNWRRAIIDTNGRYVERPTSDNPLLFRVPTAGQYYLVLRDTRSSGAKPGWITFNISSVSN